MPILEYTQALQKRLEKVSDLEIQSENLKEIFGKEKAKNNFNRINVFSFSFNQILFLDELAHVQSQGKDNCF